MALITTTEEIKQYLVTDATFDPLTLLPFVPPAKVEIVNLLGTLLYQELLDYYESQAGDQPSLDALLPYVQRPLVYFSFLKGLDIFNVSIGNNGIAIVSNSTLAPASKDRVESLRKTISDNAYDALEDLLLFLEDNIDDYAIWEASDAYAFQHEYLIHSARIFDNNFNINRSRLTFLNWRQHIADMELLHIIPTISVELLIELKSQIAASNVSENNQKVLPHLLKALAYLTAGAAKDPAYHLRGMNYLMIVKKMLDAAPDDYPTYKTSSLYDETLTSYERYENDEESNLAIFG